MRKSVKLIALVMIAAQTLGIGFTGNMVSGSAGWENDRQAKVDKNEVIQFSDATPATDYELVVWENTLWQRMPGETRYFIAPVISDPAEYLLSKTNPDDTSGRYGNLQLTLVEITLNDQSRKLLSQLHVQVPDSYALPSLLVMLPAQDLEELASTGAELMLKPGYGRKEPPATDRSGRSYTIWSEGFEQSLANYTIGSTSGSPDVQWKDVNCTSFAGNRSLWCAGGGSQAPAPCSNYLINMNTWVYNTSGINLEGYTDLQFSFRTKYQIENNWDFMYFLFSEDGSNWSLATTFTGSSAGYPSAWVERVYDLTGDWADFYWRFDFVSDYIINQNGAYLDNLAITTPGQENPDLTISPSSHDFGDIPVSFSSGVHQFTIGNTGGQDITGFIQLAEAVHFEIISGSGAFTLSAGESLAVQVEFIPQQTGSLADRLEIVTGEFGLNVVPVTGTGVRTPELSSDPLNIEFPTTPVGSYSEPQPVEIAWSGPKVPVELQIDQGEGFKISLDPSGPYSTAITLPAEEKLSSGKRQKKIQPAGQVARGPRPPIELDKVPVEAYYRGKMYVKLTEETVKMLPAGEIKTNGESSVVTGVESLDLLNEELGVLEYAPLFLPLYDTRSATSGFRSRHEAWEFHLWYELLLDERTDIAVAVEQFSAIPEVLIAEPVFQVTLHGWESETIENRPVIEKEQTRDWIPNDPRFDEQWHYYNTGQIGGTQGADISLKEAWEITTGIPGVIVAIIDDGIQLNHPDLAANIWTGVGFNFVDNNAVIVPGNHGTHVAGTVAAQSNNNIGVAGIAGGSGSGEGVRLMSCQVFKGSQSGGFHLAPVYAADNGAAISQNSWGYTFPGVYNQSALDAIDYFNANGGGTILEGGITIFAAGNSNSSANYYPGFYSGTLAVAATNNQDQKAWYSNYGDWVDISAPGGETWGNSLDPRGVLSTVTGNGYAFFEGTSMACPHVSGAAALILSFTATNNVPITNEELFDLLVDNTDNHYSQNPSFPGALGSGRLNAFKTLEPLADQNEATVWVRFEPEQSGNYNGMVNIFYSNITASVYLTGTAVIPADFTLELTVFLEGAYDPGGPNPMNTSLLTGGHLPLQQPYGPSLPYFDNPEPVWYYTGGESVETLPAGMVDWVLVELRDAPSAELADATSVVARRAALLHHDGQITDTDGSTLVFDLVHEYQLFAVVYHRNHLAVISSQPLLFNNGTFSWDFTTGNQQAHLQGHKHLGNGIYGMYGGDGDANGQVQTQDKNEVWNLQAGQSGYHAGDFDLNGQVQTQDKNEIWNPNSGVASQVP